VSVLRVPKPEVRQKAIDTLNWLLAKHDYDNKHTERVKREAIAGIYFPLILMANHPF
jgi:hypothetical protein